MPIIKNSSPIRGLHSPDRYAEYLINSDSLPVSHWTPTLPKGQRQMNSLGLESFAMHSPPLQFSDSQAE